MGILSDILEIIFPKYCVNCGLVSTSYVCCECKNQLIAIQPECFITRRKNNDWSITERSYLKKVYYFYKYDDILHNLITDIKFRGEKDKVTTVTELILHADEFRKIDFSNITYITYIPVSNKKLNERGFIHTRLLAKQLSKSLGIPFLGLLTKHKNTHSQVSLNRISRLSNVRSTMKVMDDAPVKLTNEHILIIDDICTTGSTLHEASRALKMKYPQLTLFGLCVARGEK